MDEKEKEMFEKAKEKAINEMLDKYCSRDPQERLAMRTFLENFLNIIMASERDIYLDKNHHDKANGFYSRNLVAGNWNLELNVPRVRNGKFRPFVLPEPYKRYDESFTDLIISLVANGYSQAEIMNTLKSMELPYSEKELMKIREEIKEKLDMFKSRELPKDCFALLIDGYHCEIKASSKVKKACIYVVLGIDMEGKKDLYGFYTFFGSENRFDWLKVFNDLIERGLKRVMIVVSDDLTGIGEAIKACYPLADHQLCFVHLQRNVRKNMAKKDASEFNKKLSTIKNQDSFDDALEKFEELCQKYTGKYSTFVEHLLQQKEKYLVFLKYPEDVRKYIYTTNAVESFNSMIEARRTRIGGFFQSVEIAEINILLSYERLKSRKWKNPIALIRASQYEITQMFNIRYFHLQTQNS